MKVHNWRTRLAAVAIALGLVAAGGAAATTAAPSESHVKTWVQGQRLQYCNWPYRTLVTWNGVATITAYSPGGAWLGSRTNSGAGYWYTPWEDIRISYHTSGSYVSTRCYW